MAAALRLAFLLVVSFAMQGCLWLLFTSGLSEIERAAGDGDTERVRALLDGGERPDQARSGTTLVHMAAAGGNVQTVMLLLDRGAPIDTEDNSGRRPLMEAAGEQRVDVVRLLLERGAEPRARAADGKSALVYALDPFEMRDFTRRTAEDAVAVVQLLLDHGADPYGEPSPIVYAARFGPARALQLLLERDPAGQVPAAILDTALDWASEKGHAASGRLLIERGASLEHRDVLGRTVLSRATEAGHVAVIQLLLAKGAGVNVRDAGENTPLMFAAHNGHLGAIKVLLQAGAEVQAQNLRGESALTLARAGQHDQVLDALTHAGAPALAAAVGPVQPFGRDSGALAIQLATRKPMILIQGPRLRLDAAVFMRLDDAGSWLHGELVASNHVQGDFAFLLNARPGRYVAVATWCMDVSLEGREWSYTPYTTLVPLDAVGRTATELRPGSLSFMGSYEIVATTARLADEQRVVLERAWRRSHLSSALDGDLRAALEHYEVGSLTETGDSGAARAQLPGSDFDSLRQAGWSKWLAR